MGKTIDRLINAGKKGVLPIALAVGIGVMASGCASTEGPAKGFYQSNSNLEERYVERTLDEIGDKKLKRINNDVWIIEGDKRTQVTHTPEILELWSCFGNNREDIMYGEWYGNQNIKIGQDASGLYDYLVSYIIKKGRDDRERILMNSDDFLEQLHKRKYSE